MSVINQMLKDLDKRQQRNPQSMSPLVEPSARSWRAYLLIAVVFIALAISAWLALRYFRSIELNSGVQLVTPPASHNQSVSGAELETAVPNNAQALAEVIEKPPAVASIQGLSEPLRQVQQVEPQVAPEHLHTAAEVSADQASALQLEPVVAAESTALQQATESTSALTPASSLTSIEPTQSTQAQAQAQTQAQAQAQTEAEALADAARLQITPVSLSPEQRVALHRRRGFEALDKQDLEQARSEFGKALQLDPRANSVREQLAALQFGRGDAPTAVRLLEEGLQLSPLHSGFRLMLARIFVQQKNWPQALFYLETELPEVSGNIDYYAMLAGLAQRLNKTELALDSYRRLVKQQPSQARWWLGYAISNDRLENAKEALAAYRQAELMGQLSSQSGDFVRQRIRQLEQ